MFTTLTDNIFRPFFLLGGETIKKLDPDRLLAPCFEAMGKEPKKTRYGGWEAKGISGHTLGHFLSALAFKYSCDRDNYAKETAIYCIDVLCSLQGDNGYIAGFPEKDSFDNIFSNPDSFSVDNFELGGWWVPYYSLHKIFRGLLDVYEIINYAPALNCAEKLGKWVYNTTSRLNNEQRLRLLKCEYGGMNDVLARLNNITKNDIFRKSAEFFTEEELLIPLSRGEDILSGKHANTQIPKIIGALSLYEITGEKYLLKAAENFFNFVTNHRSYAIGGHSIAEHFEQDKKESLATNTCETCNTNNMLTLSKKLWDISHNAKYFDFIEKALFNHILASNDETGMKTYFVGLKPGNFKVYSTLEDSFWCCFGSGLENPFSFSKLICEKDGNDIYLNLFIPSKIKSETFFSELKATNSQYIFTISGNFSGTIHIRKPRWSSNFSVTCNGKIYKSETDGYIIINDFSSPDTEIIIDAPRDIGVHKKRDEDMLYFSYGPFILAEKNGKAPCDDHAKGENDLTEQECSPSLPLNSIEITKINEEEFSVDGHKLVPFFRIIHGRYTVYFDYNLDKVTVQ